MNESVILKCLACDEKNAINVPESAELLRDLVKKDKCDCGGHFVPFYSRIGSLEIYHEVR